MTRRCSTIFAATPSVNFREQASVIGGRYSLDTVGNSAAL